MPLASNSAAAARRKSIAAVPKPKSNAKQPFNVIDENHRQRRDSISSVCSTGSTSTSTNHRLSLPRSVPSTTIVTKDKVDRRRSLMKAKENERQHQDDSLTNGSSKKRPKCNDDEENNNGYSPPETRSAKKKRKVLEINPSFFDETNRANALLQFSPPDHFKNEQREKERMQQKEHERAQRIAEARRSGQLLLHQPTDITNIGKSEHENEVIQTKTETIDGDLLKKMSDEVSRLAQSQNDARKERLDSDAQLLQKVHEMISTEKELLSVQSVNVLQSTTHLLEQNNSKFIEEINALNSKLVSEKESYAKHTTLLEMQVKTSQQKIAALEKIQSELRNQLVELEAEKAEAISLRNDFQRDLNEKQNELQVVLKTLDEMKLNTYSENETYCKNVNNFQLENKKLQDQLEQKTIAYDKFQDDIRNKDETILHLQQDVIPNLQDTIEMERDNVARLENSLEMLQLDMEEANKKISLLNEEMKVLQNDYETIENQMQNRATDYEEKIQELVTSKNKIENEMISLTEQLKLEIQQLTEANITLKASNDSFLTQQKQLNDALEESMAQLDHSENEKRAVDTKLKDTLKQIDVMKKSLSSTTAETSEMIHQLTEQVRHEQQIRQTMEHTRSQLDTVIRNQKTEISNLHHQLQITTKERDDARSNMDGFDVREKILYEQLQHYEQVRREMHSKLMQLMGNIRVFVRIRPKLPDEDKPLFKPNPNNSINKRMSIKDSHVTKRNDKINDDDGEIFRFPGLYGSSSSTTSSSSGSGDDITKNIIEVTAPYKDRGGLNDRRKQWTFGFDNVFAPDATQQNIWDATAPLIQCAVDGYNVTIFAYGQTGSGKTYTMLGEDGVNEGIIGRTVRKLFDEKEKITDLSRNKSRVTMSVELLEIYNEKVRDLLSSGKDDLKITSNEVVGNVLAETNTVDEVLQVLKLAQSRRCVKATDSNSESSRSHMIFTIHFTVVMSDGVTIRNGKVNICDLAGSERLDKSGANNVGGALLEETKNINKSLSVLSNVIERLQAGDSKNVPFRESKLTFLLKDSLSGILKHWLSFVAIHWRLILMKVYVVYDSQRKSIGLT